MCAQYSPNLSASIWNACMQSSVTCTLWYVLMTIQGSQNLRPIQFNIKIAYRIEYVWLWAWTSLLGLWRIICICITIFRLLLSFNVPYRMVFIVLKTWLMASPLKLAHYHIYIHVGVICTGTKPNEWLYDDDDDNLLFVAIGINERLERIICFDQEYLVYE